MPISPETLRIAYQALAALPATNARQATVLARCLMELEEAIAEAEHMPAPETPVLASQPIRSGEP